MKPQIAIVICTLSRPESLKATLETIGKVIVPSNWDLELIVVDNGPTDSTKLAVTSAGLSNIPVRYLQERRKGKVHACNAGMAASNAEIFMFTDDDVRVPANWVIGMCDPILKGLADAVQGGVRIPRHLDRSWLTGALRVWLVEINDPRRPPEGVLVGSSMALSRKAIKMGGGFDIRLGPGAAGCFEDTMLGWRLKRAGGRVHFDPEIAVEHYFDADRLTLRAFVLMAQRMAVSRSVATQILNPKESRPSISDLLFEIPGFCARCVTQAVTYLMNRQPDPGFVVRYYRLCFWMARRNGLQEPSQLPWLFQ